MRLLPLSVLLTVTLIVPLQSANAQAPVSISLGASTVQLAAAAELRSPVIATTQQQPLLVNDPYRHGTRREGMALMIVGAAGLITGLLIDEPAVTIISAGVGGLGLYFYLR
jgi:hypothetical protein